MLERVSALTGAAPFEGNGVKLSEAPDFTLTQVAGSERALKKHVPKCPEIVGVAVDVKTQMILRVGPRQFWIIGEQPTAADGLAVTPLSSSRTRIALEGPRAREVLAKCAAIDFHTKVFALNTFAMTGIHHMPVLIHCTGADNFHIYGLRTFALSLWEVLVDAARS